MPPSSFLSPICLLHSFTSTLDDVHQDEPPLSTVFKNNRKSLIRHYERSGQTVLPDRSLLIRQKFVENVKIQKCKCAIVSNFQILLSNSLIGHLPCVQAGLSYIIKSDSGFSLS